MADRGQVTTAGDEAELTRLLDAAVSDPGSRQLGGDDDPGAAAIRRFGDLVDGLLS